MVCCDLNMIVIWVLWCVVVGNVFGGGEVDELLVCGVFGIRVKEFVDVGLVFFVMGFCVEWVICDGEWLVLVVEDGCIFVVDWVVVLIGFCLDLLFLLELCLELDVML